MATGKVKWFNDQKGFGFIVAENDNRDVFVHHTVIEGTGFRTLEDGEALEFEAESSAKGLKATKASLSAVPDAKVVYANLDDFLTGVVQGINEAGKSGQITVTGFDGIPSTLAMVRNGQVGFEVALQPKKWGATALQTMVGKLDGKQTPGQVDIQTRPFDKTNAGGLTTADLE